MRVREQGLHGKFRSTLYSSFACFVRPVYSTWLIRVWFERSISECKPTRLKMWMRSLVQENPPTISDKFNVLEIISMESERTQVLVISDSLVMPFRRKLL